MISVVIPTYGRPEALVRCLRALERQEVPAREVVVVCRRDDEPTREALARFESLLPLKVEVVEEHRQSVAMNTGVAAATSPIVAMTDDDAAPRPGWIAGLEALHAEVTVGAAGGRDLVHTPTGTIDGQADQVGIVTWYGRCVGNHHLGSGAVRDVDFLKGVNLSVRRDLWHLDERLQGTDIQTHWEMDVSLGVRRRGLRVIYDPALVVDHYPRARVGSDDRPLRRTPRGVRYEVHNETLALLKWLPLPRGLVTLAYGIMVGSVTAPGFARSVVAMACRDLDTARLLPAALAGHSRAVITLLSGGRMGRRA
jgi:glycosyltransferase involved in cell wall biosynthesis